MAASGSLCFQIHGIIVPLVGPSSSIQTYAGQWYKFLNMRWYLRNSIVWSGTYIHSDSGFRSNSCRSSHHCQHWKGPLAAHAPHHHEVQDLDQEVQMSDLKKQLLAAIASLSRVSGTGNGDGNGDGDGDERRVCEILTAIQRLEDRRLVDVSLIQGKWSLIYSTQRAQGSEQSPRVSASALEEENLFPSVVKKMDLNDRLYKFFFKFAPFLAGSQDRKANPAATASPSSNSATASPSSSSTQDGQMRVNSRKKSDRSSLSSNPLQAWASALETRNEQILDWTTKRVDNLVQIQWMGPNNSSGLGRIPRPFLKIQIRVEGFVKGQDPSEVVVTFDSFKFKWGEAPWIQAPLPSPRGKLKTTFCDGDMRISRGSRGGVFVLKKIKS